MRHRLFAHAYWLIGGLAIVMVLLPVMAPGAFYLRVAALVYINAIAVIGLNLLMGYAGQVSLGHAGFFGIGAYAVGLGPAVFRLPVWASLLAGVAFSIRGRGFHCGPSGSSSSAAFTLPSRRWNSGS